jgi:hypothetical protein
MVYWGLDTTESTAETPREWEGATSMKKLSMKQQAWLNSIHIIFAAIWLGAGVCMVLVLYARNPANGDELHAIDSTLKLIDDFIIIPAALGSLFTGLLLSWLTPWGFFRFVWVTLKWVGTISLILFGTFWLGPWLNGMEALSATDPAAALQNPTYQHNQFMNTITAPFQIGLMLFLVVISVLKPWKKWKK